MAKFLMECDVCGQPIEVSTGLFAKKRFTCECGYTTGAVQMTEEVCPECRDDVIRYDRREMSPVCPTCGYVLDRQARFGEAIKAEKERRAAGIERSPFLTVDLSKLFSQNTEDEVADSSETQK